MRRLVLVGLASCGLLGEPGDPPGPTPDTSLGGPALPVAATPETATPASTAKALPVIRPPFDIASTAGALDAWPRIIPGVHARSVTSFDRSGGNDDGFAGTYSSLYTDDRGEHVIFDETGPGVLRTLWFTSRESGDAPLALGRVSFYFDDEVSPRLRVDANALFAGTTEPFVAPLVAGNFTSSGGFASWAPLAYRTRLRVTTEQPAGFYQIHYDELPPDWDVASYRIGSDGALATRFGRGASTHPLEDVALDTARSGSGVIEVLRFVPDVTPSDADLAAARIRIWFDGVTDPQVDVPLGFFFGSAIGLAKVTSVAWTMEDRLFESRMPMPFWSGVRVAVTGLAGQLRLYVGGQAWKPGEAGTLEAHWREERPTEAGRDFVYADLTGAGKLVATVLGVDPLVAEAKQWWEGDLRTRIDDARSPAINGTGHEDDHLGGWSNEFLSRPFSLAMQGAPRTVLYDTGAAFQKNGRTTMYRLWPGIPFYRAIRHSTEHGTQNGRAVPYAAATFAYRLPRVRKVLSDAFDVGDPDAVRLHAYDAPGRTEASLTSAFEGESAAPLTARLHEYRGPVSFTLAIQPDNDGVELRRLFDHAEAPVRNTLEVDGVRVTSVATWGPVAASRSWSERDLFIPAQLTRGKSKITVRWVPGTSPSANRPSNAARFEAWTLLR